MEGNRYTELSGPQRDTLRLYHQHLQIKQIAEELGVAVSTVNHRLKQSREILGMPSSRAAARWMVEHEDALEHWTKNSTSFSSMVNPPLIEPGEAVGMSDANHVAGELRNIKVFDDPTDLDSEMPTEKPGFPWPFPTAGRRENDLNWKTRLALVVPVAIILMVCAMTLVVLGIGFQELLVNSETWVTRLP